MFGRLYTKNTSRFPDNVEWGDIVKGLPISDASCKAIYCSHVLEHMSLDECKKALSNTLQYLRPGGVFRLVLPDLEYFVNEYIADVSDDSASRFMVGTSLGIEKRDRTLSGLLKHWMGSSSHLWMWDYKSMSNELREAGFNDIRRSEFGDSNVNEFKNVEVLDRWQNCLGIECRKES